MLKMLPVSLVCRMIAREHNGTCKAFVTVKRPSQVIGLYILVSTPLNGAGGLTAHGNNRPAIGIHFSFANGTRLVKETI